MFSFGSFFLDVFSACQTKNPIVHDSDDESDDDIDRDERIEKNVEEMEKYCKPLLFLKFHGQTSTDAVNILFFIFCFFYKLFSSVGSAK